MKVVTVLAVAIILFVGNAFAHEGMIALFTDSTLTDADDQIGLYEMKDIYLFYLRGYGPEALAAYEFRFTISSPDVYILEPDWPPGTRAFTNSVTECVTVVGVEGNLCSEWGTGDAFYLGTIPVINIGDPDSFTVLVSEPVEGTGSLCICLCETGYPIYPVIGDIFVFNESYEPLENPTPPRLLGANANTRSHVVVMANEEIDPVTAENESNYHVFRTNAPADEFNVLGAILHDDGRSFSLLLDRNLMLNVDYTLEASGIEDLNGYVILPDTPGSKVTFVPSEATATLLSSYHVALGESSVEIQWVLSAIDAGTAFFVLRAAVPGHAYEELPGSGITRVGLSFAYSDVDIEPGKTYVYRIDVADESGRRPLFETEYLSIPAIPLALYQNYPNPFNPSTTIKYYLPGDGLVALDVFDVSGRRVVTLVNTFQTRGPYAVEWDGTDSNGIEMASGVYLYRVRTEKESLIRKMIMLR